MRKLENNRLVVGPLMGYMKLSLLLDVGDTNKTFLTDGFRNRQNDKVYEKGRGSIEKYV